MNKIVLSVENLSKIYLSGKKNQPEVKALNNLCFDVKQGEIFGLLGPNGAGKTTFLSILAGTVGKTSGKINVWGTGEEERDLLYVDDLTSFIEKAIERCKNSDIDKSDLIPKPKNSKVYLLVEELLNYSFIKKS